MRLAEDLATVDVLSGGRLNPGVSVGPPMRWDDVRGSLYPDTAEAEDVGYRRVERLLHLVEGGQAGAFSGTVGVEVYSDRVQPHSPGLRSRLWYGGGSLRSARWAGEHRMNFLTSSVVKAEGPGGAFDFAEIRRSHVRAFRFARGLVGTSEQIAERLHAHAAFREVTEVAFALPFAFEPEDYEQILGDIATRLGPALGWRPAR